MWCTLLYTFFFTIPPRDILSHPCKWQLQSSAIEVFFIVTASHKMCPTSLWRPYVPAASSSRILRLCSPNIGPGLASKTICNVTNHTCRPLKIKFFSVITRKRLCERDTASRCQTHHFTQRSSNVHAFATDGGLQFGFYLKKEEEEETILTQLSVIQLLEWTHCQTLVKRLSLNEITRRHNAWYCTVAAMTFTNYSVYVFWLFRLGVGAAVNESHCFLYSLCQSTDGIHSQVRLNSKHTSARTHSYTHASVPACPHTLTVHPQHSSLKDSHCWSNPPTPPWCTCKVNMYKRQTGKVIGGVFLSSASAWQQSRLFVVSVGLDFPAPMELVLSVCAPLVS